MLYGEALRGKHAYVTGETAICRTLPFKVIWLLKEKSAITRKLAFTDQTLSFKEAV